MDRLRCRNLAVAVALVFAGTGAYAHGTKDKTAAGDATVTSGMATSADTGKTAPFSGAQGIQSTPMASDEDQNDEGAARGKSATAPRGKASGYTRNDTNPGQTRKKHRVLKDRDDTAPTVSGTAGATPEIQSQNSNASPSSSETAVKPSTATTR